MESIDDLKSQLEQTVREIDQIDARRVELTREYNELNDRRNVEVSRFWDRHDTLSKLIAADVKVGDQVYAMVGATGRVLEVWRGVQVALEIDMNSILPEHVHEVPDDRVLPAHIRGVVPMRYFPLPECPDDPLIPMACDANGPM